MESRLQEIDFVKGLAIISVILLHTLSQEMLDETFSSLHIGQAVPLFLFITFYLCFKGLAAHSGTSLMSYYFSSKRIKRVVHNVAIPFFIVVILEIIIRIITDGKPFEINDILRGWSGSGPGNYYFWIYIQLWVAIPFLFFLMRKLKWMGCLSILIASIILNIICYRINISPELYRLLCVRYLFLSVPAYLFSANENNSYGRFHGWIFACILISFSYLLFFTKKDLAPFVLDFGWAGQQWPSYFWTYLIFAFLIFLGTKFNNSTVTYYLALLGRNSWYIFLTQMFILSYLNVGHFSFVDNLLLQRVLFISIVFITSVLPVFIIKRKNKV